MSVKMRQEVERKIAHALVTDIVAAGFVCSVAIEPVNSDDPADHEIFQSSDVDAILAAMFAADEDWLKVYSFPDRLFFGWVRFIYGNDGWDVVSDYTTNLEPYMTGANAISDHYAD